MSAPAFFSWLIRKYPSIVVRGTEEKARSFEENGQTTKIPVDTRLPNPNKVEFDNLYLDMNSILLACCRPEGKPAPKNDDDLMVLVSEYIDRLFSIVRPRRLLYVAIDGVTPRAKMDHQRSQKFRTSKEKIDLENEIEKVRDSFTAKGIAVLPSPAGESTGMDINCITPGTEFMYRHAEQLHFYIQKKLSEDLGWEKIMVILSDASVPGEAKHKIMDYIRRQRAQPDHAPNTRHCLCGADADLVMLGLATHEVNFTIIREDFKVNQVPTPCQVCGQKGHIIKDCRGLVKIPDGRIPRLEQPKVTEQEFVFLKLSVLREYLYHDLNKPDLPFKQDPERAIDDWVLMCFLVGNDFIPRLPSLDIEEINQLFSLYNKVIYKTGGYLTISGIINTSRMATFLKDLGKLEEDVFKKRRDAYLSLKRRNDEINKRKRQRMNNTYDSMDEEEEDEVDDIKLWEEGHKTRFYKTNFGFHKKDHESRTKVANEYVKGICWVLKYYYQGCASWNWYFPYHYAPFASDFVDISNLSIEFEKNSCPLLPLEHLMSVLPVGSKQFLPPSWGALMDDPHSPIINFYPTNLRVDLNENKFTGQGVVVLPFVDELLLLKVLDTVYADLTDEESKRNVKDRNRLYVSHRYQAHHLLEALYKQGSSSDAWIEINPKLTQGIRGKVSRDEFVIRTGEFVKSLMPQLKDHSSNRAICVKYENPIYPSGYIFSACLLKGARIPIPTLKSADFNRISNTQVCPIQSDIGTPMPSPLIRVEEAYQRMERNGGGYNARPGRGSHSGSRYAGASNSSYNHRGASTGRGAQNRSAPYTLPPRR